MHFPTPVCHVLFICNHIFVQVEVAKRASKLNEQELEQVTIVSKLCRARARHCTISRVMFCHAAGVARMRRTERSKFSVATFLSLARCLRFSKIPAARVTRSTQYGHYFNGTEIRCK